MVRPRSISQGVGSHPPSINQTFTTHHPTRGWDPPTLDPPQIRLKGRPQLNAENGQKSTRNCISFHTIRQCPPLHIFNLAFLPQACRDAGNHVDDQRSLRGILHHPGGDAWPPHPRGTCSPEVRPLAISCTSLQISTRTPCAPRTCVDSCMRAGYESYVMR